MSKYICVKHSGADNYIVFYRIPKNDDVHIVASYINHISRMNLEICDEVKDKQVSFYYLSDCFDLEIVDEKSIPTEELINCMKFYISTIKISCELSPQDLLDMKMFVSCKICNIEPDDEGYNENYWPFSNWCHGPKFIRFSCNRHE